MKTAIDSNILIDVIGDETALTGPSIAALDRARTQGALVVSPVVIAEISGHFTSPETLKEVLAEMGIAVGGFSLAALHQAGTAYVRYRLRSTKPRTRMPADFMVGAHALEHADALLTRDRGYYRTYFPGLRLIAPETG
jgi:hypothetical protein